ncbi:hypothetical protein CVT24_003133 [Panaeolus cyanescens]|uniref:peptidylprolyl isomerase n=1 Tax=Panaeolus cyanescens TaxID=181874 RepID=A0A409X248_9AGAR|nr:hypothetical protein CVT24_003133 [Panaeolus cyanescens]
MRERIKAWKIAWEKDKSCFISVTDLTIGTGPLVQFGDDVTLRYFMRGGNIDAIVCLQSESDGELLKVGDATTLPKGVSQGLIGMCVGGKRVVHIPSKFGYGNRKNRPALLKAYESLFFECELIAIKSSSH